VAAANKYDSLALAPTSIDAVCHEAAYVVTATVDVLHSLTGRKGNHFLDAGRPPRGSTLNLNDPTTTRLDLVLLLHPVLSSVHICSRIALSFQY
jgi:hypothetical protein